MLYTDSRSGSGLIYGPESGGSAATGSITATEPASDNASATGQARASGSLSATEPGADTCVSFGGNASPIYIRATRAYGIPAAPHRFSVDAVPRRYFVDAPTV